MMITPFTRNAWVSPLERLYALQREFDRTIEGDSTNGSATWVPPMDVVETTDEVLCHLEVPGMSHEDLDIRVQDNMLVISGEKKYRDSETTENGFRSIERRYGRFERSFSLPRSVDTGNVKARHENGVLTIVLPKIEASKPRKIEIEGGSGARELNK